eukprot:SM000165S02227  [mRNA]  locus=s165:251891:254249:- [translate_table: standard]
MVGLEHLMGIYDRNLSIDESSHKYDSCSTSGIESAGDCRPSDDSIIAQENAIEAAESQKSELVGDKEGIAALAAEYAIGTTIFRTKIESLSKSYGAFRRARGDGNCFFRSFMFSYLEQLLNRKDKEEVVRMLNALEQCKHSLVKAGYPELTWEDFLATFVEQLEAVVPGDEASISIDDLVQRCRDPTISNYVVIFLRFVTSCEIQARAEFFEPFILGLTGMDVLKFCRGSVEPMGEESDHVQITALTDALGVPVRVEYLDRSSTGTSMNLADTNHHDFFPLPKEGQSCSTSSQPLVHLLYRPGHYDILYPREL